MIWHLLWVLWLILCLLTDVYLFTVEPSRLLKVLWLVLAVGMAYLLWGAVL
jgi:hypothetical protein